MTGLESPFEDPLLLTQVPEKFLGTKKNGDAEWEGERCTCMSCSLMHISYLKPHIFDS